MKSRNGKVRVTPSLSTGIYEFCERMAAAKFLGHSPSEVAGNLAEWKAVELIASGVLPPPNLAPMNGGRENESAPRRNHRSATRMK